MKKNYAYKIHGINLLLVSSNRSLKSAIDHQLAFFSTPFDSNDAFDIVIDDYSSKPIFAEYQVASEYYYFHNELMDIPSHKLCFDISGGIHKYFIDHFTLPVNLIIQLALQRKGKTLVHSASISYQDTNILLPALGGIGKTTLVSEVMKKGGSLYGDDMCIIDQDANMYAYPIDFSVYHYHYDLLGIKRGFIDRVKAAISSFLKLFDKVPLISWITIRVRGKFFPECKNISPISIYGRDRIAKTSKMNKLIYIGRHASTSKSVIQNNPSPEAIADKITTILLSEWKDSLAFLQIYSTFSSEFSYLEMCNQIYETSFKMASRTQLEDISIDSNVKNKEYIDMLWKCLWN